MSCSPSAWCKTWIPILSAPKWGQTRVWSRNRPSLANKKLKFNKQHVYSNWQSFCSVIDFYWWCRHVHVMFPVWIVLLLPFLVSFRWELGRHNCRGCRTPPPDYRMNVSSDWLQCLANYIQFLQGSINTLKRLVILKTNPCRLIPISNEWLETRKVNFNEWTPGTKPLKLIFSEKNELQHKELTNQLYLSHAYIFTECEGGNRVLAPV